MVCSTTAQATVPPLSDTSALDWESHGDHERDSKDMQQQQSTSFGCAHVCVLRALHSSVFAKQEELAVGPFASLPWLCTPLAPCLPGHKQAAVKIHQTVGEARCVLAPWGTPAPCTLLRFEAHGGFCVLVQASGKLAHRAVLEGGARTK
eukprot:CAMPEP_0174368014 /NCGR_PEP_ID=MMETSP0811_2-20130205/87486_1 /TAXON_ID=73025 ORGANISM="Eutreptiella gymnastica-like, Strain CCMP1594" /NCGR_SAMPLE_ID=MMETSP0811_2 /ASSEMBLY_ACC=CAM_ASM_000667 /LENGTH=148 /DNA_ID=CAMNT_0015511137 /DNA_START=105 /DNA_END=552 /DNA_ORIENTATION=+